MLGVPFSNTLVNSTNSSTYELNVDNSYDPSLFYLKRMTNEPNNATGIPLSAFNFLNQMEYSMFYSVVDPTIGTTYLLSYFVPSNLDVNVSSFPLLSFPFVSAGADYASTADKLCWGSTSQGVVHICSNNSFKPTCVKATLFGQPGSEYFSSGFIISPLISLL